MYKNGKIYMGEP